MMSEKDNKINPNFPKEWETARTLLSFFDDKLYDLRKVGFTFITALIAAQGLLSGVETEKWPDAIKFAVLLVTILLIVGLTIIERNFIVIQRAGGTRARVLERTINLELSEIIGQRFRSAGLEKFATGLYTFFVFVVLLLGWFTLGSLPFQLAILAVALLAIAAIFLIRNFITVDYPYGKLDWTIDPLVCTQGDEVGITLTNLDEDQPLKFTATDKATKVMWDIRKEGEQESVSKDQGIIKKDLEIPPNDSYTWLWSTGTCCGVYRVYRATKTSEKPVLLKRKILIRKKPEETKPEPIKVEIVKT
jgi:hypothetical protein